MQEWSLPLSKRFVKVETAESVQSVLASPVDYLPVAE
jgi:hypothetical protein